MQLLGRFGWKAASALYGIKQACLQPALAQGFRQRVGRGYSVLDREIYPDTADISKLPTLGIPTLSLAGSSDCSAKLEQVQEGWATLPSPSALVVLAGVTHYQFTDSEAEDLKSGCTPSATLGDAHAQMEQALLKFLSSALADGTIDEPALRLVPNATVEIK